jgi:hypothetical protein
MAMESTELTSTNGGVFAGKALSRAERALDRTKTRLAWDETYTLPENLFLAYQRSGQPFYRDMAKQFLKTVRTLVPFRKKQCDAFRTRLQSRECVQFAMQAYITPEVRNTCRPRRRLKCC